jgi:hypothetical protein
MLTVFSKGSIKASPLKHLYWGVGTLGLSPATPYSKNLYSNITVTLFIIVLNWKTPKCPSIGEWINEVWYIHTIKH